MARGYSVIVSNAFGSGTSVVAALTLNLPPPTRPTILLNDGGFGFHTNRFGFNLAGVAGQNVVVESSSNLVNWTALATNTLGNGPLCFSDPASGSFPQRFYRARLQ